MRALVANQAMELRPQEETSNMNRDEKALSLDR
jgi:hypothetical protein